MKNKDEELSFEHYGEKTVAVLNLCDSNVKIEFHIDQMAFDEIVIKGTIPEHTRLKINKILYDLSQRLKETRF